MLIGHSWPEKLVIQLFDRIMCRLVGIRCRARNPEKYLPNTLQIKQKTWKNIAPSLDIVVRSSYQHSLWFLRIVLWEHAVKARAEKQAFSTHPEPFAPYPTDRGSGLQRQLRGQRHANCAMHDCARARGNGDNCLHIIYIYTVWFSDNTGRSWVAEDCVFLWHESKCRDVDVFHGQLRLSAARTAVLGSFCSLVQLLHPLLRSKE